MPANSVFRSIPRTLQVGAFITCLVASLHAESSYTPYTLAPFAGTSSVGSSDGQGTAARFNKPLGVATDKTGNVYVADTGNQTIRKISPSGVVTTLAGEPGLRGGPDGPNGRGSTALFSEPTNLTVDPTGNVFITDFNGYAIRKITADGEVSTHINRNSFDPQMWAIQKPWGITNDTAGNLYYTDWDTHTVQKIDPAKKITTVAGLANQSGTVDGPRDQALLASPAGIAIDSKGNLFVSQWSGGAIRKISPDGTVSSLTNSAAINAPYYSGIETDALDNLIVTGTFSGMISKISPTGTATVVAGSLQNQGPGDYADGPAATAKFEYPEDVAVDSAGNLFVADTANNVIQKITPAGVVSTLAGLAAPLTTGSIDGSGETARFYGTLKICSAPGGYFVVVDQFDCTIRKITANGTVSTIAGASGISDRVDGTGKSARFKEPSQLAADSASNIFIFDQGTIRKITSDGNVATVVSTVNLTRVKGLAIDAQGTIFLSGDNCIKRINSKGEEAILAGVQALSDLPDGYSAGSTDGTGSDARFNNPTGLTFDSAGNLYVADTGNHTIRKITPSGMVTTVAGTAGSVGHHDGKASLALFFSPDALAFDHAGNLLIVDRDNSLIRKLAPDGMVSTVAGLLRADGNAGGTGKEARFHLIDSITTDATGSFYVPNYSMIYKGTLATAPVIITQPASQTAVEGNSVQFSVSASGASTLTYQWYFKGSPFAGATSNTLSFSNVRTSDAGDYTVVVSNPLGSVTSNKATLTVTSAPTPSPNPESSSGSSSGGGGSIGAWFVLTLAAMSATRKRATRRV